MIIYAVLTEQSIGRLFMAGIIPGIILTLLFIAAIYVVVARKPELGPPGPKASTRSGWCPCASRCRLSVLSW